MRWSHSSVECCRAGGTREEDSLISKHHCNDHGFHAPDEVRNRVALAQAGQRAVFLSKEGHARRSTSREQDTTRWSSFSRTASERIRRSCWSFIYSSHGAVHSSHWLPIQVPIKHFHA